MKGVVLFSMTGFWLALAAPVQMAWSASAEKTSERKPSDSTNVMDKLACERQLNIIYGAIQEYRKRHDNDLPAKLSDLTPEPIHDANVLVCPVVQKRGGLRSWKKQVREIAPDPFTSYGYESPPVELNSYFWRGLPKKTWREFRERQIEVIGPGVPIVRCHNHRPWLNLAFGGDIYENIDDIMWEKNFVDDDQLISVWSLYAIHNPPRPQLSDFPLRDPRAESRLIDLIRNYNATLTNSWQGFAGNDLSSLPAGIHNLGGIPFDVRGVIQLRGTEIPAQFPREVTGIKIGQKCKRVHFLHAASYISKKGSSRCSYVMHYADGRLEEFPIRYGHEIADWWCEPQRPPELTHAKVVWTGNNEASRAYDRSLCLYHAAWENPWKDLEIATISFESAKTNYLPGPFVLAITLE